MEWWGNFFDASTAQVLFEPKKWKEAEEFTPKLLKILAVPERSKILDLACGTGRYTLELAKHGYKVTGLDYSKQYIEEAQKLAKRKKLKVEFIYGDMRKLSFENRFDAVINMFTSFGYFKKEDDHFKVLKEVTKCLKVGGKFFLDTVNREWLIRHYQPKSWSEYPEGFLLEERKLDLVHSRSEARWILIDNNGKKKEYCHSVRIFSLQELTSLLENTGFKVLNYFGNFEQIPWSIDSNRTMILAQKL